MTRGVRNAFGSPEGASRSRTIAGAIAAFGFLNLLCGVNPADGAWNWGALFGISPEAALLVLGICLYARPGATMGPAGRLILASALLTLSSFRAADTLIPEVLNRPFNLYLDVRLLPDLLALLWQTASPARFWTGTATLLVVLAGMLRGTCLALRLLEGGLAALKCGRYRAGVPLALAAGALAWVALTGSVPDLLQPVIRPPILPRMSEEIGFILDLRGERQRQARAIDQAIERASRLPATLEGLGGASVFLFIIESYGEGVFTDSRLRAGIWPVLGRSETQLRAAGFAVASALLASPTYGGSSWLAHGTLASGVRLESQIRHDLLLSSPLVPLAAYFDRTGYRTVRAMPGTRWPWPAGAFYRYRRTYLADDFGYRGPAYGWASMPDQYVLDWINRNEIQPAATPLFVEFILVSSHAPFDPQPRLIDDWSRIGDGAVFHRQAPRRFPVYWTNLSEASEAYASAMAYELDLVTTFASRFLPEDALIVVMGDHPPSVHLTGPNRPSSVPVHVFSRRSGLVEKFMARGYRTGLFPAQPPPHPGMERFFWDFLEDFGGPR